MEETKLKRMLSNLKSDVDMLLDSYHNSSQQGVAEMKKNISSLTTKVQDIRKELDNTTEQTFLTTFAFADFQNEYTPIIESTETTANRVHDYFVEFLGYFLSEAQRVEEEDIFDRMAVIEPIITKLRDHLDNLSNENGVSSDDFDALSTKVDSLDQSHSLLELKCDDLEDRVEVLEAKVENLQNQSAGTDPDYCPIPYEQEVSDRIKQTYAKFSRKFASSAYGNNCTSPKAYFYAERECTATIKITLSANIQANCTCDRQIVVNDEAISVDSVIPENGVTQKHVYIAENVKLVQSTNIIYALISIPYTVVYNGYFVDIEVIAPNVEVLNQFCPYQVDSFNGKYYITDCTGENAKMAIIDANKMVSVDNLVWKDMGVKANFYRRAFGCTSDGETLTQTGFVDVYQHNETLKFLNEDGEEIYSTKGYLEADWLPQQTDTIEFLAVYTGTQSALVNIKDGKFTSHDQVGKNLCYCASAKNGEKYAVTNPKNYYGIGNKTDGTCCFLSNYGYDTKTFSIGIGINGTTYLDDLILYKCSTTCYFKFFDKMLRIKLNTYTKTITINSTEEIGPYEKYFDGINNDYFVVKNGKLKYFKKPSNE